MKHLARSSRTKILRDQLNDQDNRRSEPTSTESKTSKPVSVSLIKAVTSMLNKAIAATAPSQRTAIWKGRKHLADSGRRLSHRDRRWAILVLKRGLMSSLNGSSTVRESVDNLETPMSKNQRRIGMSAVASYLMLAG